MKNAFIAALVVSSLVHFLPMEWSYKAGALYGSIGYLLLSALQHYLHNHRRGSDYIDLIATSVYLSKLSTLTDLARNPELKRAINRFAQKHQGFVCNVDTLLIDDYGLSSNFQERMIELINSRNRRTKTVITLSPLSSREEIVNILARRLRKGAEAEIVVGKSLSKLPLS